MIGKMKKSRLMLGVMMLAMVGAGGAAAWAGGGPDERNTFSFTGSATQFGRGLVNVGFCWLEIPHEIKERLAEGRGDGRIFNPISATVRIALGTVKGSIKTVERAAGGVLEVALFPFPPYRPLMNPAWPPYLNYTPPPRKAPRRVEPRPEPRVESRAQRREAPRYEAPRNEPPPNGAPRVEGRVIEGTVR